MHTTELLRQVEAHRPADGTEARHREEFLALLRDVSGPFARSTFSPGHITASLFIVDRAAPALLLHHHRRLDRWLQMGGHVDAGEAPDRAALREGAEESGLTDLRLLVPHLVDLDIHPIPAGKGEPDHLHFDVRFVAVTTDPGSIAFDVAESKALAWFGLREAAEMMKSDESARVVGKIEALLKESDRLVPVSRV